MELNAEQLARVRDAISQGREVELDGPKYRRLMSEQVSRNMRKLAALWGAMSEEERDLIRFGLAERAVSGDPWSLDVGAVAADHVLMFKGVRGQAVEIPGLRGAVRELWSIWKENGKPAVLGKLDRSVYGDEPKPAYAACDFVAQYLLLLLPDEFERTRDPEQRRRTAEKKADTQLRELVQREKREARSRQKSV